MKLLSASEIKQADAHSIAKEPVSSIHLMERAAAACCDWISQQFDKSCSFKIFCGTGNNGGDGLAVARMLALAGYPVQVFVIVYRDKRSDEFNTNEQQLSRQNPNVIKEINGEQDFPEIQKNEIVIDAIFGTGLNKPAEGLVASCIRHINRSLATTVAIDVPSGLYIDSAVDHRSAIIKAKYTLSFQVPKLAFMFAENDPYVGSWKILDIGLDKSFIDKLPSKKTLVDSGLIKSFLKPRNRFSHKGLFGHALLIAGTYGKIGAAVLASRSCLRTGAGLLTVHVPKCGYQVLQAAVPEAMVETDADENIYTSKINFKIFSAVAVGCGIGTEVKTMEAMKNLLTSCQVPLVLDADAINMLGLKKNLVKHIPENSILTPHPKEFERITEKARNDFHRHELQIDFALQHKVFVILKGAHTCIACPDGTIYFNSTGNPGMAKGGSGDALTGIILSLLAQQYAPKEASVLGVYLHGLAGDFAGKKMGMQSMLASDLIENLGEAFKEISRII